MNDELIANFLEKEGPSPQVQRLVSREFLYAPHRQILLQLKKMGQLERILNHPAFSEESFRKLLEDLIPVDSFYKEIGGVLGYHETLVSTLRAQEISVSTSARYHPPQFIDISQENEVTHQAIEWGIEALPNMAEMIALGGAADRLHLTDEVTKEELPAAKLKILRISLLERLIRDIQAREFLFFQKYQKQIVTPIALMTSLEKQNHFHIEEMLEENHWFHRPKEAFRTFIQPLVPVIDVEGNWIFTDSMELVLKPGGHGVIWKLAKEKGIFDWFEELGKTKALIRQINNPIAGLDYGLLAFLGIGHKRHKKFGFASCPRKIKTAEGVNVLIEKDTSVVLTNIEYCDFQKFGIEDLPAKSDEPYSHFSSNTNLLFADLAAIREAINRHPFPGLIVNLKPSSYIDETGERKETTLGRLESTMQNIADAFSEEKRESLCIENTFITKNRRDKTISTAKRAFVEGGMFEETPEKCLYDFLLAARDLLQNTCGMALPLQRTFEEYLQLGPEFLFQYHPALGPLYSMIQQKIKGGMLAVGSELLLEIVDVKIQDLYLDGSLQIYAHHPMGCVLPDQRLSYSTQRGRCLLKNVSVCNQGVLWDSARPFWRGDFEREETVEIHLEGASEWIAENVQFEGSHQFHVPDGVSMRVSQEKGKLHIDQRPFKPLC